MILHRDYDKEKKLDRVWYKSSSVLYSECDDKEDSLKTLRVVFNNGSQYEYSDVDVNDYVMFVHGGLDGSNGKALNQFVKKKNCPFRKMENADKNKIEEDLQKSLREHRETKAAEN